MTVAALTVATALAAATGPHPRLYAHDGLLAALPACTNDARRLSWEQVRAYTDAHLTQPPPRRLRGDFRRAGELAPYAAVCRRVTGAPQYLALARRYMLDLARRPHWGDDRDIEAAHLLYGIAVAYDWLHHELTPDEAALLRGKLSLQAARLARRAGSQFPPLNNHRTVILSALGVAAHALGGEDERADAWLATADAGLRRVLDALGDDGFTPEGVSYWSYLTEYLLKYALARPRAPGDLLDHPWLRRAADMPLQLALPAAAWRANNMFFNLDDSPRFCWYGPHHQLFALAQHTGHADAFALAESVVSSGFLREHADWLALLWRGKADGSGDGPRENAPPLTHVFDDWDVAVMRSGWTPHATMAVFRCTPLGGRHNLAAGAPYPGSGHAHPDANSFAIFSRGAWLAVDAGATTLKRTAHHNTVLVNGVGQHGEEKRWMDGRKAYARGQVGRFVQRESTPKRDTFVGDATACYRRRAGLTRFLRQFTYRRPDRFSIVDDLETRRDARFEWLLHTPGAVTLGPRGARIVNGGAQLALTVLEPADARIETETVEIPSAFPAEDWTTLTRVRIKPAERRRRVRFRVELTAQRAAAPTPGP